MQTIEITKNGSVFHYFTRVRLVRRQPFSYLAYNRLVFAWHQWYRPPCLGDI